MPLSSDEQLNHVAQDLVNQLKAIFGTPGGFRPGKPAKG